MVNSLPTLVLGHPPALKFDLKGAAGTAFPLFFDLFSTVFDCFASDLRTDGPIWMNRFVIRSEGITLGVGEEVESDSQRPRF